MPWQNYKVSLAIWDHTTLLSTWHRRTHPVRLVLVGMEGWVDLGDSISHRPGIEPVTAFIDKKAQLSLTNPRNAKACQKLFQFDVLTTLSLTILAYLHSFSCCCVRNLRNPEKFTENSNLWSLRSSKVIDLGVNGKPMWLHINHYNFRRISYLFRDIHS